MEGAQAVVDGRADVEPEAANVDTDAVSPPPRPGRRMASRPDFPDRPDIRRRDGADAADGRRSSRPRLSALAAAGLGVSLLGGLLVWVAYVGQAIAGVGLFLCVAALVRIAGSRGRLWGFALASAGILLALLNALYMMAALYPADLGLPVTFLPDAVSQAPPPAPAATPTPDKPGTHVHADYTFVAPSGFRAEKPTDAAVDCYYTCDSEAAIAVASRDTPLKDPLAFGDAEQADVARRYRDYSLLRRDSVLIGDLSFRSYQFTARGNGVTWRYHVIYTARNGRGYTVSCYAPEATYSRYEVPFATVRRSFQFRR
ncbi:MAG: hypothetical protein HY719_07225 [Planctomycetes bacterium]|nr:hypothetical protein [Planctomycetota bacterium]